MSFSNNLAAFAFGIGMFASGAASAATFNFDTAYVDWSSSIGYDNGGIHLDVSGTTKQGTSAKVATWSGWGLGVCNAIEAAFGCPSVLDQHGIDNFIIRDDLAVLTFDKKVKLTKLVFNGLDNSGNTFDLYVDGSGWVLNDEFIGGASAFSYSLNTSLAFSFGVAAGNYESCITILGHEKCFEKASAFKLRSVEVAAVPLPAAGLLLLGGLAGLGALRRRKA
jgi:hypothetical protein